MSCARRRRTRVPRPRGETLLRAAGLEARQFLSASPANPEADLPLPSDPFGPCTCPVCTGQLLTQANASIESPAQGSLGSGNSDPNAYSPRASTQVPIYNSLPGAAVTLHLDFNGHTTGTWGSWSNVSTPAFDTDGDTSTFSTSELIAIEDIWRRVAEDYAPFNINVTTVDPGNVTDRRTLKIAIGGSYSDWFGSSAGGVGYVGGFNNGAPNVVFVFAKNLGNGNARYTAEAASHEAGHGFGLQHQSSYSGTTKTAEYSQGNANWAPIMGVGYYSSVTTWHNGANSNGSTSLQDDMSIIAGSANGFGYRADDHGGTTSNATNLVFSGNSTSVLGVIAQNNDQDWFRFTTTGGAVSFQIDTLVSGANFDSILEIRDATGSIIASSAPTNSLDASLSLNLGAGTYFASVHSSGVYGYVGQYKLSGAANPGAPAAQPEIEITQGTTNLTSGSGTFSFGSTTTGAAVTKVFTVKNTGAGPLSLTALTANILPAGYSIVANLGSTTLAAGASTTFSLKLNATAVGTFAGSVILANTDASESSFRINLTGAVTAPAMVSRILDNGSTGFTTAGRWTNSTTGYQGDSALSNKNYTGNTATWNFGSLAPGRYQVYTTYTARSDAATQARFTLQNGSQTVRSVVVNERLAPTGTTVSGAKWVSLGTVDITGNTLKVTLSVTGNALLIADAIRIQQVPTSASAGSLAQGALAGDTAPSGFLWQAGNPDAEAGGSEDFVFTTASSDADPAAEEVSWSSADFLPGAAAWAPAAPVGDDWQQTADGFFATGGSDFQEINDRLDALDAALTSLLKDEI